MNFIPIHNAKLREILLRPQHQVVDKFTRDALVAPPSFDPEAKQRAGTLVISFRHFIEDNKTEIEAISILYSRPYAAGLRYGQVKELAHRLSIKPFHIKNQEAPCSNTHLSDCKLISVGTRVGTGRPLVLPRIMQSYLERNIGAR